MTLGRVVVATPWYPTSVNPMLGSFVVDQARLAASLCGGVSLIHADEWPGGDAERVAALRASQDYLLSEAGQRGAWPLPDAAGGLYRVPTMITGGQTVAQRAEEAVECVARALPEAQWRDTEIVHGHVGYLGGLVAARLAPASARVVVTEHSSGLRDLLDDPHGAQQYAEVLDRCHRLLCVSEGVRATVVSRFPQHADRVSVLPNPVDINDVPVRIPEARRDRWVYLGGLTEKKGVVRLVRAFALAVAEFPQLTLTLIGDGEARPDVERLAVEGGFASRVRFTGSLPHDEALNELAHHDVLVHLSEFETFGVAPVEACAAGLAVVITRCGGPEESLGPYQGSGVEFVDVSDDVESVVAAWRVAASTVETTDTDAVRADLDRRFGSVAYRRSLADVYGVSSDQPHALPVVTATTVSPPVTIVATTGWRGPAVRADLAVAADAGLECVLVTSAPALQQEHSDWVTPTQLSSAKRETTDPASGVRGMVRRWGRREANVPEPPAWVPPPGSTVVAGNPHSYAVVANLLRERPDLRLMFELPPGVQATH